MSRQARYRRHLRSREWRYLKARVVNARGRKCGPKHAKPFASFEAFATHRLWQGLETSIDDLRVFCRKHPEVVKLILREMDEMPTDGGDRRSESAKADQANNVSLKQHGNSAAYTLKRLKRDHADLFQKVIAGKLSANAAAIKAGFRKKPLKCCPECGHEWR